MAEPWFSCLVTSEAFGPKMPYLRLRAVTYPPNRACPRRFPSELFQSEFNSRDLRLFRSGLPPGLYLVSEGAGRAGKGAEGPGCGGEARRWVQDEQAECCCPRVRQAASLLHPVFRTPGGT